MNTTLVQSIEREHPLSFTLREAFTRVDRAHFVPWHYEQKKGEWEKKVTGEQAYENRALVTQVTDGWPTSSSSMPSVMAAMLDALDIHEGQHILEIGTGTGYNAALLAYLIGQQGQIVTVDIDEEIVEQARERLTDGNIPLSPVLALPGDGAYGYPQYAPYDRILLTAGFRHILKPWCEQLTPGGLLVGNLLSPLFTIMIRMQKTSSEKHCTLQGTPTLDGAFFMEMRQDHSRPRQSLVDWTLYDTQPVREYQAKQDWLKIVEQQDFFFFLHSLGPRLQQHKRALGTPERHEIVSVLIDPDTKSSLTFFQDGHVIEHGWLWQRLQHIFQDYQLVGSPTLSDYGLRYQSGVLTACLGKREWTIAC
jgi:protein-L-isoaspartate(D-aspartate) O-methyltransferase